MSELLDKIIEAKGILGDKQAEIIAEGYPLQDWCPEKGSAKSIFNQNDNTPSMMWMKKDYYFKDFSTGKVFGILDYYMYKYNEPYMKAVKRLLDETGVSYNPSLISSSSSNEQKEKFKNYRFPREDPPIHGKALEYMAKRHISADTCRYVGLGSDARDNVSIPYRDIYGRTVVVKYRPSHAIKHGMPKYFYQKDADVCPILFNIDKIDISRPLLLVEGPMDAMACIEAGYTNVASIPSGAADDNWIGFNYEFLDQFQDIILWFDNDEAGEIGVKKAIPRLGEYRIKIVKPIEEDEEAVCKYYKQANDKLDIRKTDANNILVACGAARVLALINSAEEIPMESIVDLMQAEEFDIEKTEYIPSGISSLDKQIYGFVEGTLNIWTAYSGIGKCQSLNTLLLGENGYFRMGDVKVGDKVYGDDGELHDVTGVYPQGVKDVYKVTFSDDTSTICSKDHLWTVRISNKAHNSFGGIYTKTLGDIMEHEKLYYDTKTGRKWNIFIPMCKPLNFPKKELPLPPYAMGCLLGDGGMTNCSMSFTNTETDIIEKLQSQLPEGVVLVSQGNNKDYRIRDDMKEGGKNKLNSIIRGLGLFGKNSHTKFIPEIYKMSSIEDRIELLRGLIDTDGEICSSAYVCTTTSIQLMKDIEFVVNTLGGTLTYSKRLSRYTSPDGTRSDKEFESYRAYIRMPNEIQIFSSAKHAKKYKQTKLSSYRSIRSIEYMGKEECQCIMVDNPSHLYLTNNCIVTHNTTFISQAVVLEAINKGESVFWFNAESTTNQMLNWILSQAAGRQHCVEYTSPNGFKYYKPTPQAADAIKRYYMNKIYVYDNLLLSNPNMVYDKMKYMYKKRGTRVFVIDNWLCLNFRGISDTEVTGIQVDFMNKLIHFTKQNNLEIHLVCHPRKAQAGVPLSEYEILGTSNIVNMADRIYGLEKTWDNDLKTLGYDRQFTVFKDRVLGTHGERIGLKYDRVTRRLYGQGDDKYRRYSWDDGSIKYPNPYFGKNGILVGDRILDYEREHEDNVPY